MLHLQQPQRGIEVMMTPHFTSAIAAFGIVFSTYGMIVASELWFVYRKHFVEQCPGPAEARTKTLGERSMSVIYRPWPWAPRHQRESPANGRAGDAKPSPPSASRSPASCTAMPASSSARSRRTPSG